MNKKPPFFKKFVKKAFDSQRFGNASIFCFWYSFFLDPFLDLEVVKHFYAGKQKAKIPLHIAPICYIMVVGCADNTCFAGFLLVGTPFRKER